MQSLTEPDAQAARFVRLLHNSAALSALKEKSSWPEYGQLPAQEEVRGG